MNPLKIAQFLRESRPDSVEWFTKGGCWEFYCLIRRFWFPDAKPLWSWHDGHVAVNVENILFDIRGRIKNPQDYEEKHISFWKNDPPHRWIKRMTENNKLKYD